MALIYKDGVQQWMIVCLNKDGLPLIEVFSPNIDHKCTPEIASILDTLVGVSGENLKGDLSRLSQAA
jgi:hypothetical protein